MVTHSNHFYKQTAQSNFTRTIFLTIVVVFILATSFLFGFFILVVSMALLPVITVSRRWIHQKQQKKGYNYGSVKITPDADDIIDTEYTIIDQ